MDFGYFGGTGAAVTLHSEKLTKIAYMKGKSKIAALMLAALAATGAGAQENADTAGYRKFRFGGYGEIVASFKDYGINRFQKDGASKERRNTIAIPRFVLAIDYKFTPKWILGAEIEFEAGGTGVAYELENRENGEYETEVEKGGEVALEQFHITRLVVPAFNVRVGHQVVPFGLTNARHEPINFFGTVRPESETGLLPSTWHETGLSVFGTFGRGHGLFDYTAMVTAGLNANGFDRDGWVAPGKQGFFETDNFTSPGYMARLDWRGAKGLRTGVSFYYCHDTGANSDKRQTYAAYGRIPLTMASWDAQYRNRYVTVRANIVYGHLGNSAAVNAKNGMLSGNSPYSRLTPVGKNALGYGAEAGVNLGNALGAGSMPVIYPFVRYEYFNPQESVARPATADRRLQTSKWSAGVNWYALPNLVVKADWSGRRIGTSNPFGRGTYNSENEVSVGVAYVGWFIRN